MLSVGEYRENQGSHIQTQGIMIEDSTHTMDAWILEQSWSVGQGTEGLGGHEYTWGLPGLMRRLSITLIYTADAETPVTAPDLHRISISALCK